MSERHWRPALATTALALLGTAAVAGCGASSSSTTAASSTAHAGVAAAAGQNAFTAAQLKDALLTEISGEKPAAAPESGAYGTLPDVQTSRATMKNVKVSPAVCAEASQTGFNSAAFTDAPASVVTFRVGKDGVSEVLVAADSSLAADALANHLPAGCNHYDATVDGKTFRYSVKQSTVSGLADKARALNVEAAGYSDVDVWSVVYQGSGFVGAVTIVGPNATKKGVEKLAADSYAYASQSLSS